MKKLTREQWEKLEEIEELEEERIEKECEKLTVTKPAKERLKIIRNLF